MPRISSKLVRQAVQISPSLVPLLRATRSLELAKNELRWIKDELPSNKWALAIARRSRLEPLQYILGSQPFGPLDIICEPGVLIPRWETEEWVSRLSDALPKGEKLRVLDACTGTGCIPLLLKHNFPEAQVAAFDISTTAVSLARRNSQKSELSITAHYGDVMDPNVLQSRTYDVITSNPPYIPEEDYVKPVALDGPELSVRMYEPELALVGDLEFYAALVDNVVIPLNCKAFVFELGYELQVQETVKRLPEGWESGAMYDLAGKLRCVVGWKSSMSLAKLVDLSSDLP